MVLVVARSSHAVVTYCHSDAKQLAETNRAYECKVVNSQKLIELNSYISLNLINPIIKTDAMSIFLELRYKVKYINLVMQFCFEAYNDNKTSKTSNIYSSSYHFVFNGVEILAVCWR